MSDNLPAVTDATREFWEHASRGVLALPRCGACGERWYPPSRACPACLSTDVHCEPVSGRGRLWSWVVMHRQYFSGFPPPYVVAMVKLDEGPMMVSTIVGTPPDRLECDLRLEAVLEPEGPGRKIAKFRVVQPT